MNLGDKALLKSWVNHLGWETLEAQLADGESAKKRVKALRQALAEKARFYRKPDWEEFWGSGRFPIPAWEAKAMHSFNALCALPDPVPALHHAVGQWFDKDTCATLPPGITTLASLMDALDGYYAGRQGLPDMAKPHLKRFKAFFACHEKALGRAVNRHPPAAHDGGALAAQLAYLPAPAQTLGQGGGAVIAAGNDVEAAATWLKAKGGRSAHTFEAYRREATRLLLWLGENRLTLAVLKVEHVERYYGHLANPPPHWLRPRKPKRHETLQPTQVLAGPLSAKSIDQARTILGQLCGYLQQAGYLRHNVFRLTSRPAVVKQTVVTKALDLDGWHWLWGWVLALPQATPRERQTAARTRWLFALLYHTGIRREEAANGKMGDFVRKDRAWALRVVGKGNKEKFVTVNSSLLRELVLYRTAFGLREMPAPAEAMPLVGSVNAARQLAALTPRAIGKAVHETGARAAAGCQDEHIRAQVEKMTTHWLRHTNATHRLMAGASLETTQDELGHADPRTTRIYAKTTDKRKQEDAEKLARLGQGTGE